MENGGTRKISISPILPDYDYYNSIITCNTSLINNEK